jgi:hypothetical protein
LDPRPEFHNRGILVDARDRRRGKLHGLRDTDPAVLIDMYRRIAQLKEDVPLPAGVNFVGIVEVILDHEIANGTICDEPL